MEKSNDDVASMDYDYPSGNATRSTCRVLKSDIENTVSSELRSELGRMMYDDARCTQPIDIAMERREGEKCAYCPGVDVCALRGLAK